MTCPGVGNILGPERQSSVRPLAATRYRGSRRGGGGERGGEGQGGGEQAYRNGAPPNGRQGPKLLLQLRPPGVPLNCDARLLCNLNNTGFKCPWQNHVLEAPFFTSDPGCWGAGPGV